MLFLKLNDWIIETNAVAGSIFVAYRFKIFNFHICCIYNRVYRPTILSEINMILGIFGWQTHLD